jgi:trans-aconitate methyltransferase
MSLSDQEWDPYKYAANARFVSDLGAAAVQLLEPQPDETILDLGCGDGALTLQLAQFGCRVVGVDSSAMMIAAAQELGLDAIVADGHELNYIETFDAVFSNAALHWMPDPEAVIRGVWNALRPGGRFVGEFGGSGNVAKITAALETQLSMRGIELNNPWFFPTPEQYSDLLTQRGFSVASIELIPRLTPLPGDIADWLETFAHAYTSILAVEERSDYIREVVEMLRPVLFDANENWHADYVRLRFAAVKPQL